MFLFSVVHCDWWEYLQLGSVHTRAGKSDIHRYPYPVFDVQHLLCTVIVKLCWCTGRDDPVFPSLLWQINSVKLCEPVPGREGEVLHQIFCNQVQHANTNWIQLDLRFCENEESKRSLKKGVNWIENQGEKLYKMLKIS